MSAPAPRRWQGQRISDRLQELRGNWLSIVQVGISAAIAFLIAKQVVGHATPFFAPIAAVLTLGLSVGQRGRRAIELAIGVALGIGVADLLVLAIGTGTWQLAVIVSLAMAAGALTGGGVLLVNQAAVSAVLVATLPTTAGFSGARFIDALIGSSVALLANALAPSHPLRMVRREIEPLLEELAEIFEQLAGALERRDRDAAESALARGRSSEDAISSVRSSLSAAAETTRLAPPRRGSRGFVSDLSSSAVPIDYALRNSRVLARNVLRALDLHEATPLSAIRSLAQLGAATREVNRFLWDASHREEAERAAVRAAQLATAALEDTTNLSVSAIVSQVRSIAVDLLRVTGVSDADAIEAVRRAPTEA